MSDTLQKILPLEYITDHDPVPETVMDSSSWFKTETVELDFGEWVGRPEGSAIMRTSMLSYFFGNGWYVDAVLGSRSSGQWKSVSKATNKTKSASRSDATSAASSYASTNETFNSSEGYSSGESEGGATSEGESSAESQGEGAPYWYAYNRIRLKRRKMQSELVLKDMISQFTKAYNEGRAMNDSRYDELVSLYSIMLSRTEDEANAWSFSTEDFSTLADDLVASLRSAVADFEAGVGSLPANYMQSRVDEINRKFDAEVSGARSGLVARGLYNSTVWNGVSSGIERNRQIALTDLEDKIVGMKIDVYGKIATLKADIAGRVIDAATRLMEMKQKRMLGPTEIRNTVFKWMLDFMERREDDYPGLDQLAGISEKLGFSDGATGGASVN